MQSFTKLVLAHGFLVVFALSAVAVFPIGGMTDLAQAAGLRCGTPYGWCWATVPGKPGQPCSCPGPDGQQIPGTLF